MTPPLPELFVAVNLPARDLEAMHAWAMAYGSACAAAERERIDSGIQQSTTLALTALPKLGEDLEGGTFAGLTTKPDGTHCAVILLPDAGSKLTWKEAIAWATKQGAELPSRPVAAMLFANVKTQLKPTWHWTSEEDDGSYAWYCHFNYGYQDHGNRKSYEGGAVAVRLIPIAA